MGSSLRETNLERLRREHFDILVIGGGITGAGIARDAALRGLRVALVEQSDFAAGTSSRSSKLVHGGFRYLASLQIRIVYQSLKERGILLRIAPHLVQPMPFLLPFYSNGPYPVRLLKMGLSLYDFLAGGSQIKPHTILPLRAVLGFAPWIPREGLIGGAWYYDAITNDARLVLENIKSAWKAGAVCVNYAKATSLLLRNGKICGATIHDRLNDETFEVRTSLVINAAGPWSDQVRSLDPTEKRRALRLTKGIHLVFPHERLPLTYGLNFLSPRDHRPLLAIPWGKFTYVGTTDTDYEGDLEEPEIERSDVEYLLEALDYGLPTAQLEWGDILGAWAGIRPLLDARRDIPPWRISREDRIDVSPAGLITIAGGKLTTYRAMAERVVNLAQSRLPAPSPQIPSRTASVPLEPKVDRFQELGPDIPEVVQERLNTVYGPHAWEVVKQARTPQDLEPLHPDIPLCRAEVRLWVRDEMAMTLPDALERRAGLLVFDPLGFEREARVVAAWMGEEFGWDPARVETEVKAYQDLIRRRLRFKG
ncbi:MAG: glycerol-3-phosphate dehydrogenase/oxidase [Armatimonadota bacterium]|nr:glycerol-3-phosphate dehydrogenase/oxidase [Armatimonadota bacterium]MDR5702887.1 glycerol-3-phosphate dehydrogenase/oxidase [Armatimonadota bacterium]